MVILLWVFPAVGILALANLIRLSIEPYKKVTDSCYRRK